MRKRVAASLTLALTIVMAPTQAHSQQDNSDGDSGPIVLMMNFNASRTPPSSLLFGPFGNSSSQSVLGPSSGMSGIGPQLLGSTDGSDIMSAINRANSSLAARFGANQNNGATPPIRVTTPGFTDRFLPPLVPVTSTAPVRPSSPVSRSPGIPFSGTLPSGQASPQGLGDNNTVGTPSLSPAQDQQITALIKNILNASARRSTIPGTGNIEVQEDILVAISMLESSNSDSDSNNDYLIEEFVNRLLSQATLSTNFDIVSVLIDSAFPYNSYIRTPRLNLEPTGGSGASPNAASSIPPPPPGGGGTSDY